MVGDHVGVQAAHVGEHARMLDQFREHVMLQAGRRRLHPAQPPRGRQERRRDLAKECVRVGDGLQRLGLVRCVHDHHLSRRRADLGQAISFDCRMDYQFERHGIALRWN
jgi:hypothetical protein